MVTRLRSRGVRSDRRHKSSKTTALVSCANFGAIAAELGGHRSGACRVGSGSREPWAHRPQYGGVDLLRGVDLLVHLEGRDRARPSAVDRQMRQKPGGLGRLDAVGERSTQVTGKLRRLSRRDQDRDRHQAAVAWRQLGPPPHVAEEHVVGERGEAGRERLLQRTRRAGRALREAARDSSEPISGCVPACARPSELRGAALYCSSLTFSIHCTTVPSRCSLMAMCVIDACGDAPCQCFCPAGILTTSPARISSAGSPHC